MRSYLGPFFVLLFVLLSSIRDVFYGAAFQELNFFFLIALSFGIAILVFLPMAMWQQQIDFAILAQHWKTLLLLNATTALAWFSYFYALKWLEPALVNTIWSGLGPLLLLAFAAVGMGEREKLTAWDYGSQTGIALSLIYLCWIVLSNRSGLPNLSDQNTFLGLAATFVSAASIILSVILSKKLNVAGINAISILGTRFVLLVVASVIWLGFDHETFTIPGDVLFLAVMAFLAIVVPVYCFQKGLQLSSTFTTEAITALGPVFVFTAQFFDYRLHFSTHSLAAIILYSFSCLVAVGARISALGDTSKSTTKNPA